MIKNPVKLQLLELLAEKAYARARNDFATFVKLCAPIVLGVDFKWGKHIEVLCHELENIEAGKEIRLAVSMPPGYMKSILNSVLFPAWVLGRHPEWQIIIISHSSDLAEKFSKMVRGLLREQEYKKIFPNTKLSEETRAANRWMTTAKGVFCAFGAGASIAGNRANIGILDDALSEQTAKSKTERQKIIDWYPGGFRSRLIHDDDGIEGRILSVATRWAQEDLTGYFIREMDVSKLADQWKVLSIPDIVDQKTHELLGLPVGESSWPEKWPTEYFIQTEANMPAAQYAALYRQQPTPEDGAIFKENYFKIWRRWREDPETKEKIWEPPACKSIIQTIDTAMTKGKHSDFSVIQTWGIFETKAVDSAGQEHIISNLILLGNVRDRWDYPELRRKAQAEYKKHKPDVVLIEKTSHGHALLTDFQIAGYPCRPYTPDKDKVSRAHAVTPLMEAGRVWILPPKDVKWAKSLYDECMMFSPNMTHAHDDQCFPEGTWIDIYRADRHEIVDISEVVSGDKVLTHAGKWKPVLASSKQYIDDELIVLDPVGSPELRLTKRHPVAVWKSGSITYKNAEDISTGDKLVTIPIENTSEELTLDLWDFVKDYPTGKLNRGNLNLSKLLLNEDTIAFDNPKAVQVNRFIRVSPNLCRLIGYYLSEGSLGHHAVSFSFNVAETNYLDDVEYLIQTLFGLKTYRNTRDNCTVATVSSIILKSFFSSFSQKASKKEFPSWMLSLSDLHLKELVKGMWRGDGCTTKRGNFIYTTSSKKLARQYELALMRLGVTSSISTSRKNGAISVFPSGKISKAQPLYNVTSSGPAAKLLGAILGESSHERAPKAKIIWENGKILRRVSVLPREDYSGFVYNLEVEEDHTYHIQGVLVHNCDCMVLALNYLREGFYMDHPDDPKFDTKIAKKVSTYFTRNR